MEDILDLARALPGLGGPKLEHVLAWVTAIMTGLSLLGWALDLAIPKLREKAGLTPTKVDDRIVEWLATVAAVLGVINALIPRPRLGARAPGETPPSRPTIIPPPLPLLWMVAIAIMLLGACGSSAAAVLPVQTVPQNVSISIDASDGGTVSVAGDVWLDARGGSAGSEAEQSGTEIDADVDTSVQVPISTGGATTGAPAGATPGGGR